MELGRGVAAELENLLWHWGGAYDITGTPGARRQFDQHNASMWARYSCRRGGDAGRNAAKCGTLCGTVGKV